VRAPPARCCTAPRHPSSGSWRTFPVRMRANQGPAEGRKAAGEPSDIPIWNGKIRSSNHGSFVLSVCLIFGMAG
jgi:hypothetical protein